MAVDRYAEIHAAHRWDVPAHFNIARRLLRPLGRRSRALRAVLGGRVRARPPRYTFWDLQQRGEPAVERARRARACARGDKVALILPQRPETVVAHIAVYQMGAVAVPLSFLFGPDALEYRLDDSEARVALVDPQSLPNLAPIRERCPGVAHVIGVAGAREALDHAVRDAARARRRRASRRSTTRADDPALLVYTSGTTGPPKGALMPQRCLLGNLPGFVHSHDGFPQRGRSLLVAGRLGVDRRPHGRAAADALLRPADRRLSRTLRSRARVRADGEVRGPQHVPVPDRAQDDDEGVPAAARALRRRPAQRS